MLSVKDDFLCVEVIHFVGVLRILMSKKIYLVVGFRFCCELHVWVERIKVILYVFYVGVAGIINYQDIINIAKICSDVFAKELCEVCLLGFGGRILL